MKATVLVARDGSPRVAASEATRDGLEYIGAGVADLDITSERALRVAVWALQRISGTSACPGSRRTAEQALRLVGKMEELPTAPSGMPEPVKITSAELDPYNLQNQWVLSEHRQDGGRSTS